MCVCVREREKGVWGLLKGVLMTQIPLRGGPAICEWKSRLQADMMTKITPINYPPGGPIYVWVVENELGMAEHNGGRGGRNNLEVQKLTVIP